MKPAIRPPVQTLDDPAPGVLRIRLQSLDLVFEGPAIDPFAGSHDGLCGMDHVKLGLKRHWGRDMATVTAVEWVVPPAEATEAAEAATRQAITDWCAAQMGVARNTLLVMSKERRRAWQTGGLFFAFCFAIAAAIETVPALAGMSGILIAETFIIAGWVGVWHPLDLTLYAWWPHRFRLKLLERTMQLQVRLIADDDDGNDGTTSS